MAMLVKELAKTLGRYTIRVNALVPGRSRRALRRRSLARQAHSARPHRAGR